MTQGTCPSATPALSEGIAPDSWPVWLDAYRVDDRCSAAAYDATPASLRAVIKTGSALAHMRFGDPVSERRTEVRHENLGYWHASRVAPVPWALIVLSSTYAAAARLTAACAMARLSGVPLVGAVCFDMSGRGELPTSAALVSLELSGVEDVFLLDAACLRILVDDLGSTWGRLVLLHAGDLDDLACAARRQGLSLYEENCTPVLSIPFPDAFDGEALAFAQADAFASAVTDWPQEDLDAVYLPDDLARTARDGQASVPLVLTPGCEGLWLHRGLTPEFFCQRQETFGTL